MDVNPYHISYIRHLIARVFAGRGGWFYGEIENMSAASLPLSTSGPTDSGGGASASGASATFSPLYQQIKALIMQGLQSGEWKPGDLIPSEIELAQRYKVSQGTVRKAIDELAAENLVVRRQGKGTFVATHHEARARYRFLRLMPDEGVLPSPENLFLEVKRARAAAEIARLLELKAGEPVIFIRRVQAFDAKPTIMEEIWLPGTIFKGLTAERLRDYKGPMYGLFESDFGTHMIRAAERLRAVAANNEAAKLLGIAINTPLLSVERVSFTYGDKPVEVRRGLYMTDRHHYQNELY